MDTEITKPNWTPLVNLVGEREAANFMFMGYINGIYLYKHVVTRRYLNLDASGKAYTLGREFHGYHETPVETALAYVRA